jgi:hypothetical protein
VFQDTLATSRATVDAWQSLIVEDEDAVRKAWEKKSFGRAERPL